MGEAWRELEVVSGDTLIADAGMEVEGDIDGGKDVCKIVGFAGLVVAAEGREEEGSEVMFAGELVAHQVGDSILEFGFVPAIGGLTSNTASKAGVWMKSGLGQIPYNLD